jgi:hypothetical protein
MSHYHSICRHIQSNSNSEHNAGCECYSSHIGTEILAMNVTVKWAEKIITVVATDS